MWVARYAHPMSLNAWGTSWSSVACRSTSARTTGRSSPPGRCGCGSHPLEPQPSSSHRVALGRMGMLRASTASLGTNSWTGSSSIPSGRCRSPQRPGLSPSCSRGHPHLLCSKRYQCLMVYGTAIGGRSRQRELGLTRHRLPLPESRASDFPIHSSTSRSEYHWFEFLNVGQSMLAEDLLARTSVRRPQDLALGCFYLEMA